MFTLESWIGQIAGNNDVAIAAFLDVAVGRFRATLLAPVYLAWKLDCLKKILHTTYHQVDWDKELDQHIQEEQVCTGPNCEARINMSLVDFKATKCLLACFPSTDISEIALKRLSDKYTGQSDAAIIRKMNGWGLYGNYTLLTMDTDAHLNDELRKALQPPKSLRNLGNARKYIIVKIPRNNALDVNHYILLQCSWKDRLLYVAPLLTAGIAAAAFVAYFMSGTATVPQTFEPATNYTEGGIGPALYSEDQAGTMPAGYYGREETDLEPWKVNPDEDPEFSFLQEGDGFDLSKPSRKDRRYRNTTQSYGTTSASGRKIERAAERKRRELTKYPVDEV